MGSGYWSDSAFRSYAASRNRSVGANGAVVGSHSNQEVFKSRSLDPALNPRNVVRQCCDSEEHPNTVPVILALDVTGSMGQAAVEVANKLNVILTDLYKKVKDVEFLIMGIGDMACDSFPAQATQFESDIRIADQLEKIYFEFGGGGNGFESYSLAWYFGLHHTDIDAIKKRGKKGIIITMGDEPLNPYLPKQGNRTGFKQVFGDDIVEDIDTKYLYKEASKQFDIYHIHVEHLKNDLYRFKNLKDSYMSIMGEDRVKCVTMDTISDVITEIIVNSATQNVGFEGGIRW